MTNTKFRKRALLSSVAMLLVALVALGSATFAWFSADPTSRAAGLTVKASTSTGLEILSTTHNTAKANDWSHDTILNASPTLVNNKVVANTEAFSLSPVSMDPASGNFYKIEAKSENDWDPLNTTAAEPASSGYYSESVKLRLTGGTSSASVKITNVSFTPNSNSNLKSSVRLAIMYGGDVIGIWAPSAETGTAGYLSGAGTYVDEETPANSKYKTDGTFLGTGDCNVPLGTVGNTGNDAFTVYVYMDGDDGSVYSTNVTSVDATLLANTFSIALAIA